VDPSSPPIQNAVDKRNGLRSQGGKENQPSLPQIISIGTDPRSTKRDSTVAVTLSVNWVGRKGVKDVMSRSISRRLRRQLITLLSLQELHGFDSTLPPPRLLH
ncbi:unnamed protein product, partial [Musa banksii]